MQPVFRRLHFLEMFDDKIDKVLMIEVAGSADNEVAGSEVMSVEARDDGPLEFFYRFARTQDGQAESVVFPETLGENLVDKIVGIVLIPFYFFENDAALACNVSRIKDRMKDKVAKNIHRNRKML